MRLILDTNAFLEEPALLAKSSSTVRMLLPQAVVQDLEGTVLGTRFSGILNRAAKAGLVEILAPPSEGVKDLAAWERVSLKDAMILRTALEDQEKHPGEDVYLVSDDGNLLQQAKNIELRTATSKTVATLIESAPPGPPPSKAQAAVARSFRTEARNYIIGSFLSGAVAATLLFLAWSYRQPISHTYKQILKHPFPVWGYPLVAACLGVAFFWGRSRNKIAYGTVEVLVGLFGAWRIANPATFDSAFAYQAATSVYIIVRGLDNIEKGLEGNKIQPLWKRFFGGG